MRRLVVLLATLLGLATPAPAAFTEVHYVMGTYFRIAVDDVESEAARASVRRCFATAGDMDRRFSRFDARSELSRLNASAATGDPVPVSPEMAAVLDAALHLRAATHATFDVAAGALTQMWRSATEWPRAETIALTRRLGGAAALTLDGGGLRRRPGVVIDLDGIAKGWAVDQCVTQLRAEGIRNAFLSFGESSLYALGAPAGEPGWPMTLRSLDGERAVGTLQLRDEAVSVSAVFGHERLVGTRRVGHIVDPRTGLPLTAPGMVAVVAPSATAAEAYSKALLIDRQGGRRALQEAAIRGAILIGSRGMQRIGHLAFSPFASARPIAAAAEPLR